MSSCPALESEIRAQERGGREGKKEQEPADLIDTHSNGTSTLPPLGIKAQERETAVGASVPGSPQGSPGLWSFLTEAQTGTRPEGRGMIATLMEHSWAIIMSPMLPFHRWENGSFVIYLESHNCRNPRCLQSLPAMQEARVPSLVQEDPLEKEARPLSSLRLENPMNGGGEPGGYSPQHSKESDCD